MLFSATGVSTYNPQKTIEDKLKNAPLSKLPLSDPMLGGLWRSHKRLVVFLCPIHVFHFYECMSLYLLVNLSKH